MSKTMDQLGGLPMFEDESDPAPFQKHSDTSRAAADAIEPNAGTLRAKVLAFIRDCGEDGATDLEVQDAVGLGGSTQRPRRVKLVELGLVRDSGGTRLTDSGRKAVVWVACESGARAVL